MTRMTRFAPLAAAVLGLVAPLSAHAQKEGKPTVAIMVFDNGAYGKDRLDYDGLTKSVPAFLVTPPRPSPRQEPRWMRGRAHRSDRVRNRGSSDR